MWFRGFVFFLILYLVLNLPFISLKTYRKRVYIYHNTSAEVFLKRHPELKKLVYLTKNTTLKPLFLITDKDTFKTPGDFSQIFVNHRVNNQKNNISIPTYGRIGDTITIYTADHIKHIVPSIGHNFIQIKRNDKLYKIDIKGIPEKIYVIDTIYNYSALHGALRRYFESYPFVGYIGVKNTGISVLNYRNKVVRGKIYTKPIFAVIGKDIIFNNTPLIHNPTGFRLAFKDTVIPTTITDIAYHKSSGIAYFIGARKIPFAYIKNKKVYINTKMLGRLSRRYPTIFHSIMDSILANLSNPYIIAYPETHFVKENNPIRIHIVCLPFCHDCNIKRDNISEPCKKISESSFLYMFVPRKNDSFTIVSSGNRADTVLFHVIKRKNFVVNTEENFISKIKDNVFILHENHIINVRESSIFYFIVLVSLVLLWIMEKRKLKDN